MTNYQDNSCCQDKTVNSNNKIIVIKFIIIINKITENSVKLVVNKETQQMQPFPMKPSNPTTLPTQNKSSFPKNLAFNVNPINTANLNQNKYMYDDLGASPLLEYPRPYTAQPKMSVLAISNSSNPQLIAKSSQRSSVFNNLLMNNNNNNTNNMNNMSSNNMNNNSMNVGQNPNDVFSQINFNNNGNTSNFGGQNFQTNKNNNNFINNANMNGNLNNLNGNNPNLDKLKNWTARNEDDLQLLSQRHEQLIGMILSEEEDVISSHRQHIDDMVELIKQVASKKQELNFTKALQ